MFFLFYLVKCREHCSTLSDVCENLSCTELFASYANGKYECSISEYESECCLNDCTVNGEITEGITFFFFVCMHTYLRYI